MSFLGLHTPGHRKRLDDIERRLTALETVYAGLATREQLATVATDIAEVKGMLSMLLTRMPQT
jgi:hypothetical protein